MSNPSNERFHKSVLHEVPDSVEALIAPGVSSIAELSARTKALEIFITRMAAEKYPQTIYLQQISEVGPTTSLCFVLKIENPERFKRTRDIGAFAGLCPRRDQSAETDKELHISKCGDRSSAPPPGSWFWAFAGCSRIIVIRVICPKDASTANMTGTLVCSHSSGWSDVVAIEADALPAKRDNRGERFAKQFAHLNER